jgi:hypothetical protein
VQFEQDTNSRKVFDAGNHASKSYFLAAASLRAPETMETTWYGTPICKMDVKEIFRKARKNNLGYKDNNTLIITSL